jgi:hypothetical protein
MFLGSSLNKAEPMPRYNFGVDIESFTDPSSDHVSANRCFCQWKGWRDIPMGTCWGRVGREIFAGCYDIAEYGRSDMGSSRLGENSTEYAKTITDSVAIGSPCMPGGNYGTASLHSVLQQ